MQGKIWEFVWGIISGAVLLVFAFAVAVIASGCASSGLYQMSDRWCGEHPGASTARCRPDPSKATTYLQYGEHTPAQSWDQANLKNADRGCPTAIFIAPGGNLEQCL